MPRSLEWLPFGEIERVAPDDLRGWLAEPGLLTARIRAACGERHMRFRMLGPLRPAPLAIDLQPRLGLRDTACLLREIEFRFDDVRLVFAQTVLPESTIAAFPWLRELGDSPLGESLRRAREPLQREPLEFTCLPPDARLARAALEGAGVAEVDRLWARRAVYRLAERPILVQEVFMPTLRRVEAMRADADRYAS